MLGILATSSADQHQSYSLSNSCRQLIEDQLPQRKGQLYNTYGPGGPQPLIPAAQAGSPALSVRTVDSANQYVEIFNDNPVAVDVSDYKLTGSASITLRAGMVLLLNKRNHCFAATWPIGMSAAQLLSSWSVCTELCV